MRIRITGRHVKITPALRRYIETRMKRLERYDAKLGDAQVVLGVEKYRHTAELLLTLNRSAVQAKTSTKEMYASIDELFDKISRQVRKHKEKLVRHNRHVSSGTVARGSSKTLGEPENPAVLKTVQPSLPRLTIEEAIERLGAQPEAIVVFFHAVSDRMQIVRRLDNGAVEWIDPQPA
jgi:putative sigma-54 modulation protein